MTAPYRESNDAYTARLVYLRCRRLSQRPGDVLRAQEKQQRLATDLAKTEWVPFDWLPAPTPPDEEPTLVMDWAGLRSLSLADQARAATSPQALVRWPADDSALPYASTVRRRFVQRGAWIRVWQDRAGRTFQDIALALLIACLLIALWLFVADLASWFMS